MSEVDATDLLKAEKYLRFYDLAAAPEYCDLTVWVDGAERAEIAKPMGSGNAEIDAVLGPVHAIETVPGCLRYKVIFEDIAGYAVRDESYATVAENEDFSTHLRIYETSRFLSYMKGATFAEAVRDRPLTHMAIVTFDLVIDVATLQPPVITAITLSPDDPGQRSDLPQERSKPTKKR